MQASENGTIAERRSPRPPGDTAFRAGTRVLLVLFMIAAFYPFFWMITTPFKSNREIYLSPASLPTQLDLSVFAEAWERSSFGIAARNSAIVTAVVVALIVLVASLAAFAISRLNIKGGNAMLAFFVMCQIVSAQIVIVPLFTLYIRLKWFDTLLSVISASTAFGIPLSVFLFWSFFQQVPREIDESTAMDGCPSFLFYRKILAPISKPVFASVIIYQSLFVWNEYLFALTFLKHEQVRTIPIQLQVFFAQFTTDWAMLFAALSMAVVPILIVYLTMQKSFIKGLTEGAVKG